MRFKVINEDYDDERMLYKRQLNAKINDVASDIAEYILEIENPSNETIQGIADDLKYHKDTFIDMINQNDDLSDNQKKELVDKIKRLRI